MDISIKSGRALFPTFLNVEVPDRSTQFHDGVRHAFKIRYGDTAHFERHVRRTRGQRLQQVAKLWDERRDVAGMASVPQLSNLQNLNIRGESPADAFLEDDAGCAISVLYMIRMTSRPLGPMRVLPSDTPPGALEQRRGVQRATQGDQREVPK